jgi:hypothetical protein
VEPSDCAVSSALGSVCGMGEASVDACDEEAGVEDLEPAGDSAGDRHAAGDCTPDPEDDPPVAPTAVGDPPSESISGPLLLPVGRHINDAAIASFPSEFALHFPSCLLLFQTQHHMDLTGG